MLTPSSPPFAQRETSWIWSAEGTHAVPPADQASPSHYQVRYFRRTFAVADPAKSFLAVHVSADSRYVFHCNGVLVGRGPAKGDINHHFYDTYDLTPHLRRGRDKANPRLRRWFLRWNNASMGYCLGSFVSLVER